MTCRGYDGDSPAASAPRAVGRRRRRGPHSVLPVLVLSWLLLPFLSDPAAAAPPGEAPEEMLLGARTLLADAKQVTMAEAISATLRQNPSLQASYAAIQASQWDLIANRRRWLPSASVQANPSSTFLGQIFDTAVASYPNNSTSTYATSTYNSSYRSYSNNSDASLGLSLNWSFFDPSRQPAINSASEKLRAQKLTFNVVARSLVLNTQILYQTLQETATLIRIYENLYEQNQHQLQLVEAQFSAGMTNIGDVQQKKSQLLNQLTGLVLLYRQQARDASDLATVMGNTPGQAVLPVESHLDHATWPLALEATVAEGLQLREEIQVSLADAESTRWDARRLVNTYLPVLMLSGTAYGYRGRGTYSANVGEDASPYFSSQYGSGASVGLGLRWDFYDGGIRAAQARQADFRTRELLSQAQDQRLNVANEIRRSYASYQTARLGLPGARQAFSSAREAVKVASRRYELGLGNMADLIQAIELMAQAAQDMTALQLSWSNAIAELYRYSSQWPVDHRGAILQDLKSVGRTR